VISASFSHCEFLVLQTTIYAVQIIKQLLIVQERVMMSNDRQSQLVSSLVSDYMYATLRTAWHQTMTQRADWLSWIRPTEFSGEGGIVSHQVCFRRAGNGLSWDETDRVAKDKMDGW
jgi:hypothetical protein